MIREVSAFSTCGLSWKTQKAVCATADKLLAHAREIDTEKQGLDRFRCLGSKSRFGQAYIAFTHHASPELEIPSIR